jgi:ADP-dependent NAD(P)H-hydrate dehydratase / NAD(P)H-hydrate epimerase
MKLFISKQIKQIDSHTINEEQIRSADLMERAAGQLLKWYIQRFERSRHIFIFVGPGNNGGDGLVLARLLEANRYDAEIIYVAFAAKTTDDWAVNMTRIHNETHVKVTTLANIDQLPAISSEDLIVDAIFGTGLTRPVEGLAGEVIGYINSTEATVVSIDIPSGLFGEDNTGNQYENIIKSDFTLTFQFPRLSFMFAENGPFTGEWHILPIGLSVNAIRNTDTPYIYLEKPMILPLLKSRNKFDHKGNFGHGLLIAGSIGKTGAAVLGASAALRSGIGLVTCHVPMRGILSIQCSLPEAMVNPDRNDRHFSEIGNTDLFTAAGVGPGIGTEAESQRAFYNLITEFKKPLVIDADGLNILSLNKEWFALIPEGTILTPHPKEFERLVGKTDNGYQRLARQVDFSREHKCIIVLKGANTSISTPSGTVYFNSTGNPGMATAGSGDVLTGILLSLLAQGYTSENAAVFGVFLHGLAGDIAAEELCYESIIASDIIKYLAKAFNKIREP